MSWQESTVDASHATQLVIVVLAIVGPLVLLGLLITLIVVLTRRATREATVVPQQFAAAARALGAQSGDGYLFRLTRVAVTSVLRLRPRTRNSSCMLSVEVPLARGDSGGAARSGAAYRAYSAGAMEVDTVEPLVLRLETGTDRIGKLLLVNREVQTGVIAFDERVYIETEAADRVVQTVLGDPAVRDDAPVGWSAVIGLAAWLLSVPVLGFVLRGRSDSLRRLVIVLVLCAVAFPTGSVGTLLAFNGWASSEPSVDRTQKVVDLWLTSGKSTTYYVRFESRRRGETSLSMSIPPQR